MTFAVNASARPRRCVGAGLGPGLRGAAWLLSVPAVALLLSACSDGNASGAFNADDFARNQAQYSLPLDSYLVDPALEEWGRNVLVHDCMEKAGFQFPVPRYAEAVKATTRNALQRKLFTLELAENYGYRAGPSKSPGGYDYRPASTREQSALSACQSEVSTELGGSGDARGLIESLRAAAFMSARTANATRSSAARWRECMEPLRIPDLPENAEGIDSMPTPKQRERWGMSMRPDQQVKVVSAGSPDEIRAAVFDAQCRVSSGYSRAMYEAEVQAQLRLMGDNHDALERAKANTDAVTDKIQAVLNQRYG